MKNRQEDVITSVLILYFDTITIITLPFFLSFGLNNHRFEKIILDRSRNQKMDQMWRRYKSVVVWGNPEKREQLESLFTLFFIRQKIDEGMNEWINKTTFHPSFPPFFSRLLNHHKRIGKDESKLLLSAYSGSIDHSSVHFSTCLSQSPFVSFFLDYNFYLR